MFTSLKKKKFYLYAFVGLIMYLLFILINPVDDFLKSYSKYTPVDFIVEILYLITFSAITVESAIINSILLDKVFPWETKPIIRIVVQLLTQILFLSFVFSITFYITKDQKKVQEVLQIGNLILRQAIVIGALMSIIITSFFTGEYFLNQWLNSKTEALHLKEQNTLAELQALKNQLDPHFLFNNFSVLTALIESNPNQAAHFVSILASVYRYVLQANKENTVQVNDEVAFVEIYFYLYNFRFGNAIELKIDINNEARKKYLCPMTMQLLVENAVKHNAIDVDNPLVISLYTENEMLVCTNKIIPKITNTDGLGIGLQNIKKRYKLLTDKLIEVEKANDYFIVKIPLINE